MQNNQLSLPQRDDCKTRKRAKIRNRYNQAPHVTQEGQWESDNVTIRHHKRKPRNKTETRNIFKKDIRRLSNTDDKRNQIRWF